MNIYLYINEIEALLAEERWLLEPIHVSLPAEIVVDCYHRKQYIIRN